MINFDKTINFDDNINCPIDGWSLGLLFGSSFIMILLVLGNMKLIILHILILTELILTIPISITTLWDGCTTKVSFIISLNFLWIGYIIHNIVVFLKLKAFFRPQIQKIFISIVIICNIFWIIHCIFLWLYFENINNIWIYTRAIEFIFKDILWIYCVSFIFIIIKTKYKMKFRVLITFSKINILLISMLLSVLAIIVDIIYYVFHINSGKGYRNPFWEIAFITKLFCDVIFLDNFKIVLNKIREKYFTQMGFNN